MKTFVVIILVECSGSFHPQWYCNIRASKDSDLAGSKQRKRGT